MHVEEALDGSLPVGRWRWTRAEDASDAVWRVLCRTRLVWTRRAWVALGTATHDNGCPMAVQAMRIDWRGFA